MAKCSQCDKPAVVNYGGSELCADHYYTMVKATYLQIYMLSKHFDFVRTEIEAGAGGLVQLPRMEMAPPPFMGDSFTLNNISVTGNNVTVINARTIQNLDASITVMRSHGEGELAKAVTELTQAIIESNEIEKTAKNEIAEQLEFLVAQATTEPQNRSIGLIKSVLAGIRDSIAVASGLLVIWDKVGPLIRATLGV
jgi:hypothetical protein